MCRIRWCDLPNDQKIVQHPHRSELLLNGRFGPRKVLNPGSHMERSHSREFQAMSGAPVKKLPASPGVSSPSVPVADRGGEEVNVGFSDLRDRQRQSAPGSTGFFFFFFFFYLPSEAGHRILGD